ncbi:TRAP transporter large permease subunit [Marivivens donghaensis]|uniref:TRAP transporter large permease subunit n=1 Tax=Marivivens donghaensis TaxID=1699413 RepID=A0ABX0VZ85_9RHOB|nr:TRAP transporter large permease subunit [Marivivens donghaensis]NIY73098.1 TRAP transporter large permease subunit [Marivivens donghaensis]
MFGLDGVEIGLIIVFLSLFGAILSGFPVAFSIGGAAVVSFVIIAALDSAGLLIHQGIDTYSDAYNALIADGVRPDAISVFTYPDLPREAISVFPQGWETAMDRNIAFIVNRMNERVLAGQSIETLLAVLMFVLMGIMLERSRIADELLTKMANIFGPLPGGLAVSIVVVGAFLAASTGIVGATVVTMGLLALPTMLKNKYSPELATGVIAASGTLGQIIPPSIVIVLLGTLAGDLYSAAQEDRAQLAGCTDALTLLGEPAVVSVGTLFQAAMLPGIMLALLYALYAFGYALLNPSRAPAVQMAGASTSMSTRGEKLTYFLGVPAAAVIFTIILGQVGIVGSQSFIVDSYTDAGQTASLRTNVSEQCQASMIDLHGQEAWDTAVAEQDAINAAGGVAEARQLSEEERSALIAEKIETAPKLGVGLSLLVMIIAIVLSAGRGINPLGDHKPLIVGAVGALLILLVDYLFITPVTSSGVTFLWILFPLILAYIGVRSAAGELAKNDIVKVVFPPLVLIVAVLGSILGGVTNPTPAAALGAGGAILLAAGRKLADAGKSAKPVIYTAIAIVLMLIIGTNFDMRTGPNMTVENMIAFGLAYAMFLFSMFGILWSCWILWTMGVLSPVVRETTKVTSMVFTILIGSQLLNLVLISFGGEHYIQDFLRSFSNEWTAFLIVMLVLFMLGFVLDFLEIIYIVIPIVGPVIYGGSFDPKWVTIMIAVNLQTSFLTPPFGFALFYLRGVAPKEVTTGHIYRGVIPFVIIQMAALLLLALVPSVVTIVPNLLN